MKKCIFSILILLIFLFSCSPKPSEKKDNENIPPIADGSFFEVHFIDVGQADSALVVCDGQTMLVDGGNVGDSSFIYSYLKNHQIDYLDYMIATHPHEDHIGGLSGALNYADVGAVYSPVSEYDSNTFEIFAEQVDKKGVDITVPQTGDSFMLGSAVVDVIASNIAEGANNISIVLKITYGKTSFLFTADVEREAEEAILDTDVDLKSTVLKVGHHGSSDSTTYPFLREIMPQYAVISVGKDNSYGHPHDNLLSRLRDADVEVYRTDTAGTVICLSDGTSVSFVFEKTADKSVENRTNAEKLEYVLNVSTKRFHIPDCSSVKDMSSKNKELYTGSRDSLTENGYTPCGSCNP